MADRTGIQWTDATWNPLRGCSRISEGCRNCYAETVASRFSGPGQPYEGLAKDGRWTREVRFVPHMLDQPLRWTRPRRIFVNSMSDLFHENVPDEWIARVFDVMARAPQHTFQVLTKRPDRMRRVLPSFAPSHTARDRSGWPLPNVWLGVSAENQATADGRIPLLLETPAAVRFVSAEPLLGPIDLNERELLCRTWRRGLTIGRYLDWVIIGGESGPGARPMHPGWARALRDQCVHVGVPFFFKQWGEWKPVAPVYACTQQDSAAIAAADESRCVFIAGDGRVWPENQPPGGSWIVERTGKKTAGRTIDGREWDQFPDSDAGRNVADL